MLTFWPDSLPVWNRYSDLFRFRYCMLELQMRVYAGITKDLGKCGRERELEIFIKDFYHRFTKPHELVAEVWIPIPSNLIFFSDIRDWEVLDSLCPLNCLPALEQMLKQRLTLQPPVFPFWSRWQVRFAPLTLDLPFSHRLLHSSLSRLRSEMFEMCGECWNPSGFRPGSHRDLLWGWGTHSLKLRNCGWIKSQNGCTFWTNAVSGLLAPCTTPHSAIRFSILTLCSFYNSFCGLSHSPILSFPLPVHSLSAFLFTVSLGSLSLCLLLHPCHLLPTFHLHWCIPETLVGRVHVCHSQSSILDLGEVICQLGYIPIFFSCVHGVPLQWYHKVDLGCLWSGKCWNAGNVAFNCSSVFKHMHCFVAPASYFCAVDEASLPVNYCKELVTTNLGVDPVSPSINFL